MIFTAPFPPLSLALGSDLSLEHDQTVVGCLEAWSLRCFSSHNPRVLRREPGLLAMGMG